MQKSYPKLRLIKDGKTKKDRAKILAQTYQAQKCVLDRSNVLKSVNKSSEKAKPKENNSNDDLDKGMDKIIGFNLDE